MGAKTRSAGAKVRQTKKEGSGRSSRQYSTCKDCGEEFVFTAGEQEFYAEKGFENEPGDAASIAGQLGQRERAKQNLFQLINVHIFPVRHQQLKSRFEPKDGRPKSYRD